jgi:hypothetical protein
MPPSIPTYHFTAYKLQPLEKMQLFFLAACSSSSHNHFPAFVSASKSLIQLHFSSMHSSKYFDLKNIILFILHYLLITITQTHDRCHYCFEKTVLPLGKI